MVNYRSRAAAALAFLLVLLLGSCDGLFNGRGGMPGYLQYVTDSVSLRALDLPEPDPGSTVSLKVVKPDSSLISYLEGLDPGIETEVLVLTYRSGQIERMRSLIFDRELNLLFDTRSLDSNFGRLTDWIFPPYSYDYPILGLGNLDLGRNSIRVQKDGGISDFLIVVGGMIDNDL